MADDTVIDFARSTATWRLREGESHGRFALVAALTVPRRADGTHETFYLGAQVFAGDVYGQEELFRQPPYEFAAAFSADSHRIFRTSHGGGAERDSFGANSERFERVDLDVRRVRCRRIAAAPSGAMDSSELVGRIRLGAPTGYEAEAEFPIRHINLSLPRNAFQVETGPVLVIAPGLVGEVAAQLRRAYVNFNRLDRAQFLIDAGSAGEAGQLRWASTLWERCTTELFSCER